MTQERFDKQKLNPLLKEEHRTYPKTISRAALAAVGLSENRSYRSSEISPLGLRVGS
jgi:hypothetical protein